VIHFNYVEQVEQNEEKQRNMTNKLEIQSGQDRESLICFVLTPFMKKETLLQSAPKNPAL
jgi:hypothetical protein